MSLDKNHQKEPLFDYTRLALLEKLLDAIPPCPAHGKGCIPHALEWVNRRDGSALRAGLAEYAHDAWAGWMKYMFEKGTLNADGTYTMPQWAVERWMRQANTSYADLPPGEKESDRLEADRMIEIWDKTPLESE